MKARTFEISGSPRTFQIRVCANKQHSSKRSILESTPHWVLKLKLKFLRRERWLFEGLLKRSVGLGGVVT
jgi:hypothetical protein